MTSNMRGEPAGQRRRLFVFRHGETVWNREGRIQGQGDSPLTRRGAEQAMAMGETLRDHLSDPATARVFVSPSGRCRQTAALIADGAGLSYGAAVFHPALFELSFGLWEGLLYSEVDARWPRALAAREADLWGYRPQEGESYSMAARRILDFLASLTGEASGAGQDSGGDVVIVGHGATGKLLRGLAVET